MHCRTETRYYFTVHVPLPPGMDDATALDFGRKFLDDVKVTMLSARKKKNFSDPDFNIHWNVLGKEERYLEFSSTIVKGV